MAADGHLDDGLDVGNVHAVAGAPVAVDLDLEVGLADDVEQPDVLDPRNRLEDGGDALAALLEDFQVGAEELDRVGPLDARERLLDVVADQLREVEVDPGELLELLHQLVLDLLAGDLPCPGQRIAPERRPLAPPLLHRPQRDVELDVEEAGDVGAVVGPADVRHDPPDLGHRGHDLAEPGGKPRGPLERDGPRQERANPEVALLELRHELTPQVGDQGRGVDHQGEHDPHGEIAVAEDPAERLEIAPLHQAIDERVGLLRLVMEQERAEDRRQCHRHGRARRRWRRRRCWPSGRTTPPPARSSRTAG